MTKTAKQQILVDHYVDFYMLAFAILRNEQDAKDAVQEAVVATLVRRRVENVYAYCRRAVYTQCINLLRSQRRFVLTNNLDHIVAHEERELHRRVRELKEEIPELARAIIELHDEEGYSVAELAVMTGMSNITLRRMIEKTHKELRKKISEAL